MQKFQCNLIRNVSNISQNQIKQEYVFGKRAIEAVLFSKSRRCYELCTTKSLTKNKDYSKIFNQAKNQGVKVKSMQRHEIDALFDPNMNTLHRGIAMKVSTVSYTYLPPPYTLPKPPQKSLKSVYLALDQIVDPYNLGSIIRTSFYYGVSGIILSEKSHSPLSPLVSSASCGSMEYMVEQKRLFQTNLPEFLGFYYKKNWTIYSTALHMQESEYMKEKEENKESENPSILVLGNEGRGVSYSVTKCCNATLLIDPPIQRSSVDSLSVNVAAGILINRLFCK